MVPPKPTKAERLTPSEATGECPGCWKGKWPLIINGEPCWSEEVAHHALLRASEAKVAEKDVALRAVLGFLESDSHVHCCAGSEEAVRVARQALSESEGT